MDVFRIEFEQGSNHVQVLLLLGKLKRQIVSANPADAWVWAVDLLGAFALLGATWAAATWSYRAQKQGVRFRLATLLGVVAVTAVVAAVWRWSEDHILLEVARFGDQGDELAIATAAVLDLTAQMVYLPQWAQPGQLVVRAGVLAGLGCMVYVIGRGFATLAGRRLRPSPPYSTDAPVC